MGDLPRILARPELPDVQLPRTNPNAYGASFFGQAAQAAAMFQNIDDAAAEAEARKTIAVTREQIKGTLEQSNDDYQDPQVYHSTASGQAEEIYQRALKSTKSDKARALIADGLAPFLVAAQSDVKHVYREKQLDKAKGDSMLYLETVRGELAQASRPMDIQNKELELVQHMQDATRAGLYKPAEAVKLVRDLKHNIEKDRAYLRVDRDPEGLIEDLKDPKSYSVFSGPERNAVRNAAESVINDRKRLSKEAQQEVVDQFNTRLLERSVAGQLKITDVLAIPDNAMTFQSKKLWIDRLERQARHDKDTDPFEKSDGATRGRVMAGVLTNPREWPQEKILGYMGNGLSNNHALQLVNMQKDLVKDKGGDAALKKYDPLNRALNTLDGLRSSYAFTKEGLDEKVTDAKATAELRLKNDQEYQKVVDEVIRRAQGGQDPRVAMQELMKPYFEQKTKGWFESISNWFTQPMQSTDKKLGPAPANAATADVIQTPSGPIRIDKNVSPQERETIIKKFGGAPSTPAPALKAETGAQIGRLNQLEESSQRYKALLQADPDEAARDFLTRNGKLVTPETLEKTKQYLKNRK
jgi:hypothetical protein